MFNLGSIGGLLVRKFVKQTKIVSRTADKRRIDQFFSAQTEADKRAGCARVLRKPDATVRQKLGCFDTLNRVLDQVAEFFTLRVQDGGSKVLDLDHALANEDDLGDFRNSDDPGIAEQLRVEH